MSLAPVEEHEQNRLSWNHATSQHHTHKPQLIEQYSEHNYNNLFEEDMLLLGDLKGKFVIHLQCNDGQDTVSIAKFLKPRVCVGVDISDIACKFAKKLGKEVVNKEEETSLIFIRSDIFLFGETARTNNNPLLKHQQQQEEDQDKGREQAGKELKERGADVVYSSYGAICWISDLKKYARSVVNMLAPGGRYILMEFHPLITSLNPKTLKIEGGMIGGSLEESEGVGDYVANDYQGKWKNPEKSLEFCHGMADILTAFLNEGLVVESVTEYPHMNGWKAVEGMREKEEGGRVYLAPLEMPQNIPLMYSVVVRKE